MEAQGAVIPTGSDDDGDEIDHHDLNEFRLRRSTNEVLFITDLEPLHFVYFVYAAQAHGRLIPGQLVWVPLGW